MKNFALNEIHLTDGEFSARKELVRKYLNELDTDRIMHTFRLNAGIPSGAKPLGGWESPDCGLRGHFVGHFLSACARFGFCDEDENLRGKAMQIVDIMEQCQKENGYLSAFPEEVLDTLEREENRDIWAPYYTLAKILQGLLDCAALLDIEKAQKLAVGLANYIYKRFQKLSYWKIDGILRCTRVNPNNEFGGIGDSLYTLYERTGENWVKELAELFDRDYFIGRLACGQDILENLHANTHLPMVYASMHRYQITGEDRFRTAAFNFYRYLKGRTFANGNSSSKATAYIKGMVSEKSEHWGAFGHLEDALTGGESESCCAHNTEKIVQKLFEWTGDADYLDHLERLKYNAVLNSASSRSGLSQYHQPLGEGVVKKFSDAYDSFWCCTVVVKLFCNIYG
nr:beta-L-arabinofuranosidase domain-containing protein [uncultured Acetatifactor sp.]